MSAHARDPQRHLGLVVTALTLGLVYGLWHGYGLILVALLREFGWSRSVLAGAFSVMTLMHGIASPVAGSLCSRMQPRTLIAWGATLMGVGLLAASYATRPWELYLGLGVGVAVPLAACGWIPHLVQVQRDFRDRLGLAMGIASGGVGLSMFVVAPLIQASIDAFGWRTTFRLFALACVVWIVPWTLLLARRSHLHKGLAAPTESIAAAGDPMATAPRGDAAGTSRPAPPDAPSAARTPMRSMSLRQALGVAPLWLLAGLYLVGSYATQTLNTHHAAFFVDRGMTALAAAAIVGTVGGFSIVAKVASGWLSDRFERELVYIVGISCMVLGIALLGLLDHLPWPWLPYAYAMLFGCGYAVTSSLVPAMIGDRFSGPHFGAIIGFAMACASVGSALGAWAAGRLFDVTGSYAIPFTIAAACGVAAAGCAWAARRLRMRSSVRPPARPGGVAA